MPGSLEAAALETISVKLHDQIYPISVADTFDPHLRTHLGKQTTTTARGHIPRLRRMECVDC
jgi:hypothetical protein